MVAIGLGQRVEGMQTNFEVACGCQLVVEELGQTASRMALLNPWFLSGELGSCHD